MSDSDFLILLSEDDRDDVLLFEKALRHAGLNNPIERVRTGQRAIEYLSAALGGTVELPSLVVLDLKTPQKTGVEVLEWIRSKPQLATLPVAIVTGSATAGDRLIIESFEHVSYYTKDSFMPHLGELVRSLADRTIAR